MLRLLTRREWWGDRTEVFDDDPQTLAHVGYSIVAMTLAEPLRKALDVHLDEHGCGTGDVADPRYVGGFWYCPEAKSLWDLLPDGDRIVMA
jgi:hypothetical protein